MCFRARVDIVILGLYILFMPEAKKSPQNDPALKKILERYKKQSSKLISILQDIQKEYRYLPEDTLRHISDRISVPLTEIYGVTTFYKSFRLYPPGRHEIVTCMGTACHIRGGPRIVDEIRKILGIEPGQTTKDGEYSLDTVNCLGCCAIGPVMVMDGKYYGQVTPQSVRRLLKQPRAKEAVQK